MFLHISVRCCLIKAKENPAQIFSPQPEVELSATSKAQWWIIYAAVGGAGLLLLLLIIGIVTCCCCCKRFFGYFVLPRLLFSKLYINLTLSILYQFSFFCTLSRSAHVKDQGGKYDSWNTEDFDNSTNGIFRKVLAIFDVNRFGHIM